MSYRLPPRAWLGVWLALLGLLLFVHSRALAGADDEEAAKKGVTAPTEWAFPPSQPLRVLIVRGLWYDKFAIERALSRLGGAEITDSWHSPDSLRFYPDTYEKLMGHHLVVVCNANGNAFGPVRRKMLKDFVDNGGTVLFLGGWYSFGPQFRDTALEEISPVTYPKENNWMSATAEAQLLAPGPHALGGGFAKLPWTEKPRVFWYHEVTPKTGSKVLATAGGKPLLVAGTYGKGRVAVFAGTVMGDPPAGQVPFWEWSGWPVMMQQTINWLTEPARQQDRTTSDAARTTIADQLLKGQLKSIADLTPLLIKYSRVCRDKETARLLLRAMVENEGDATIDLIEIIIDCTRPYIDVSFADTIHALISSGLPHRASLGLRLLGISKTPNARKVLEAALKTGEVESVNSDDLVEGGRIIQDPGYVAYAVRLGALEGLGSLGDPGSLPLIKDFVKQFEKLRSDPAGFPTYITREDELYQEALLAALRCGDREATGAAVDMLLENRYVVIRMLIIMDAPLSPAGPDENMLREKARVARILERTLARPAQLDAKLANLPDSVLPALARRIAEEEDPRVISIAYAAFGRGFSKDGRKIPTEALAALKGSRFPAIADLALEIASWGKMR